MSEKTTNWELETQTTPDGDEILVIKEIINHTHMTHKIWTEQQLDDKIEELQAQIEETQERIEVLQEQHKRVTK